MSALLMCPRDSGSISREGDRTMLPAPPLPVETYIGILSGTKRDVKKSATVTHLCIISTAREIDPSLRITRCRRRSNFADARTSYTSTTS